MKNMEKYLVVDKASVKPLNFESHIVRSSQLPSFALVSIPVSSQYDTKGICSDIPSQNKKNEFRK